MSDKKPKSAADKKAERSNVIEEQIKEVQRRKDERAFLEELAKRISIAREGKMLSDRRDFTNALVAYRRFLKITAKAVNVEVDELRPSMFDEKTMRGESLLMSSIIFDMLKILDKLETPTARQERQSLHKLFVRFTVNQPFQMFAAENLRKYLMYRGSIKNKAEFWASYNAIKIKRVCFVATWAFGSEDGPELDALRSFRDGALSSTAPGRIFIEGYYRHGGKLPPLLDLVPGAKPMTRLILKGFVRGALKTK